MSSSPAIKLASASARRSVRTGNPVAISVLPAVDVHAGIVTFMTPGRYHHYHSSEPIELNTALDQAVRPAQWIPEIATLVVTVAQTGVRAGRRIGFRLTAQ